jgi:hypothetical protein
MSLCPRTDLPRVCRALCQSLGVLALLWPAAAARAQLGDAGAADARVAPAPAASAGGDAGPALSPPEPTGGAAVASPSAPVALRAPEGRTPWLSEDEEGDGGEERSDPNAPAPGRERSTDLKYLLERVEVRGNRQTKVRMVEDFVPLEVGSSFCVSDP